MNEAMHYVNEYRGCGVHGGPGGVRGDRAGDGHNE